MVRSDARNVVPTGKSRVATRTGRASLEVTQNATEPARAASVTNTPMSARGSARRGRLMARAGVRVATAIWVGIGLPGRRRTTGPVHSRLGSSGRGHVRSPDRFRSSTFLRPCQDFWVLARAASYGAVSRRQRHAERRTRPCDVCDRRVISYLLGGAAQQRDVTQLSEIE